MATLKEAFIKSNEDRVIQLKRSEDARIFYRIATSVAVTILLASIAGLLFGEGGFFIVGTITAALWQPIYTVLVKYFILSYEESINGNV